MRDTNMGFVSRSSEGWGLKMCRAAALVFLAAFGLISSADAAVIQCPGTPGDDDREFTIDAPVGTTCFASGTGNLSGNPNGQNPDPFLVANPTLVLLDKTDDTDTHQGIANEITIHSGIGGASGTFSVTLPSGFTTFYLALKSGTGQLDPDWVVFQLAPGTISNAQWTVSSQGLSHMNLYAVPAPVPVPGALPLLLAALGALLSFVGWRRRRAAA
jgi:hypothetical protein